MKSDIDALMQARNFDAILVLGNAAHNPPMYYFMGGGHVSGAALIKKRGSEPILFCQSMEREEAAKSGLRVVSMPSAPRELLTADDAVKIFKEADLLDGCVGVYGEFNSSVLLAIVDNLARHLPNLKLIGEINSDNLFKRAMETKSEDEAARIRKMGQVTVEVVRLVADYLTSREVRADEVLLNENGAPLTIGDVHAKIRLWAAERGAEMPDGFIFSIGRDAGVPHSIGTPGDLIRLGRTIIFDIFPAEAGGGYFYDFTRTWSLGYATPEAQRLYNDVHAVYKKVVENLDRNAVFIDYQQLACEEFEKRGHKTKLSDPAPVEGYVHGLGHGLGLYIHERPESRLEASRDNLLQPGVTFTIEPGLYYPERGMGARIEDSYWMRPDGVAELLAEYPYDFVLPMKKV